MTAENLCARCGRPTADGYVCTPCANRAAEQLRQIVDMLPAARDVAHGLSRRGGGGNASGKPGSQIPIDLTAMAKLDAVQNELLGWVRHIAEERGGRVLMTTRGLGAAPDVIVAASEWLQGHLDWLRHRQEVSEALAGFDACARVVSSIARGPAEQKFLGPCGAPAQVEVTTFADMAAGERTYVDGVPCDGDIYAREGASVGSCRTCGAEVASEDRRAWLDAEVRSHAFRAAEIANAYGINVKTIRSWATDRQARYDHSGTCVQVARPAKLHPHGWDRDQRPLFLVGDVLDLYAAEAARREEARAERARRKEASAA